MKKIFTFKQSVMNGLLTVSTEIGAFSTRELAERARQAVVDANRENDQSCKMYVSDIEETMVYDTEDEIPILTN